MKLVGLRRPKIMCSPSCVDYRCKTNAIILLDMGHPLKGDLYGRDRERKETKNLNVVDVLTV
jgi:hypothetical protein